MEKTQKVPLPQQFEGHDPPDVGLTKTSGEDIHGILQNSRIRRLTPRECFRLQGIEDQYFEKAAAVCSDAQLYRQAGNAVTVPVVYEIAKRIQEIIKQEEEGIY